MYRTIADFLEAWDYESKATLKLFNQLTDTSLDQRVTVDGRSLGDLAWHITATPGEMLAQAGLSLSAPEDNGAHPARAAEIADAYQAVARSVAEQVPSLWSDASLAEEVEMYGERWTRGKVLSALLFHQTHHRGQMTVLMRQAGLKVPGVYGPSREEWAGLGLPAVT
jgi:uncharacterized damage-inducible protein DinB